MTKQSIATTALFTLLAAASGCASATTSPSMRSTLSAAELTPSAAPAATGGVELVAVPVQLGQWNGPGSVAGKLSPVAMRVPQAVPSNEWYISPTIEPTIVGTDIYPAFDYRTIPMLPYGSFWVEVTNRGAQPLALAPQSFTLEIGGKQVKAMADGGSISGRWKLTLDSVPRHHIGSPRISPRVRDTFQTLPILTGRVDIAAGSTWKGYVVFDTGAYLADEYNELLRKKATARLDLNASTQVTSVSFGVANKDLPAVCLPGTKETSFRRCEVLAR